MSANRLKQLPKSHTTHGGSMQREGVSHRKKLQGSTLGEISRTAVGSVLPSVHPREERRFFRGWMWPCHGSSRRSQQQNYTPAHVSAKPDCVLDFTLTWQAGTLVSFSAPAFCCLLFLITSPFLPADLQASFQVPLPEAGACSFAPCCLLVGHELRTAELTERITIGGHCWTLTNIINTQVVAVGLFFKFTLIKISFIFKT